MGAHHTVGSDNSMRTLFVVPWDQKRGGVTSVVANVARHLEALGHPVLFHYNAPTMVMRHKLTKLGFHGVELRLPMPFGPGIRGIIRTLAFPFLFTLTFVQLTWLLKRHGIRIVNLHYPTDNCMYFAVCRRLLPIKLVASIHGRDAFEQDRPKRSYSWAFRFMLRSSDVVILPSENYRQKLAAAIPSIAEKTIYIHNGVHTEHFAPRSNDGGIQQRYILCVAELQEYKAIDVLIRAAQPLLIGDPSLTLVLAGDGPLRAELEELASSLKIRNQTMFLGTQDAPEILRLLHGCEVMVLPSRMEPFGIALIEAMACRTAVIACRVGGVPEIIEHEKSGLLVEPDNPGALSSALHRLLSNETLRRALADAAYHSVMARFRAAHNASAYLETFSSILMDAPPRSTLRRAGTVAGEIQAR